MFCLRFMTSPNTTSNLFFGKNTKNEKITPYSNKIYLYKMPNFMVIEDMTIEIADEKFSQKHGKTRIKCMMFVP